MMLGCPYGQLVYLDSQVALFPDPKASRWAVGLGEFSPVATLSWALLQCPSIIYWWGSQVREGTVCFCFNSMLQCRLPSRSPSSLLK